MYLLAFNPIFQFFILDIFTTSYFIFSIRILPLRVLILKILPSLRKTTNGCVAYLLYRYHAKSLISLLFIPFCLSNSQKTLPRKPTVSTVGGIGFLFLYEWRLYNNSSRPRGWGSPFPVRGLAASTCPTQSPIRPSLPRAELPRGGEPNPVSPMRSRMSVGGRCGGVNAAGDGEGASSPF